MSGVSSDESSLASTEYDIIEARTSLESSTNYVGRAGLSRGLEKALASLEGDVVGIAKEHRNAESSAKGKNTHRGRVRNNSSPS